MDERCIAAIHVFGNNIMYIYDVLTFKVMQFAPLLNVVQKKFPHNLWLDTKPGCQAILKDIAYGITKGTYNLWSHKFILWVCSKLVLD